MTTFMLLDITGIGSALVMGAIIYWLGGPLAFLMLFLFLVFSDIATISGKLAKTRLGLFESKRSWRNVIANSAVPAVALYLGSWSAFLGGVSAIIADKFSSELGVLGGDPRSIHNLKKVPVGTSGGVTILGFLAGMLGSAIIAWCAIAVGVLAAERAYIFIAVGFAGNVVDSFLGVAEEAGIGNKYSTNMVCSAVGAALGHFWL